MKSIKVLFISLLAILVSTVFSQDSDNFIIYGTESMGEITNRNFEIEYIFSGNEGDVIVIELVPDDRSSGITSPSILLLDNDFNVLESVEARFSSAVLVYELSEAADYYVLATRRDGRSGDSVGKYTLRLNQIEVLMPGEPVSGTASNQETVYFAVRTTSGFDVSFARGVGAFSPELSIKVIDRPIFGNDNLNAIATLSGDGLRRGSIGVNVPNRSLYIVTIASGLFDFSFRTETSDFTLELIAAE